MSTTVPNQHNLLTGNYPQTHIIKENELDTILSPLYLLISFESLFTIYQVFYAICIFKLELMELQ